MRSLVVKTAVLVTTASLTIVPNMAWAAEFTDSNGQTVWTPAAPPITVADAQGAPTYQQPGPQESSFQPVPQLQPPQNYQQQPQQQQQQQQPYRGSVQTQD